VDPTAQDSGAAADLSRHLQKGSTGRLSTTTHSVEVDVYVMNGAVVAAESSDDIKLLLRRLYAAKALSRARATEFGGLADLGEGVFGMLLEEVDTTLMEEALFERFRDNVSRYLGVRDNATFHPMGAVFVENFQMGHNTSTLLHECTKLWRQSRHVPLSMVLAPSHTEDATPDQQLIADRLDGRRTVRQVLHDVPVEPVYGRAVLAQMLANGIATKVSGTGAQKHDLRPPPYEEARTAIGGQGMRSQGDSDDTEVAERTVLTDHATVLANQPSYSRDYANPDDETEVVDNHRAEVSIPSFPSDEIWDDYVGVGLEMLDEPSSYRRGLPAGTDTEDLDEDSPTVMADYDFSSTRVQRDVTPPTPASELNAFSPPAGDPESWLQTAEVDLDDDILDAFADHDYVRGGSDNDGMFTQDLLERVEVADLQQDPDSSDEPIPVDDGPTRVFGIRTLGDQAADAKLAAANTNLIHLVHAFDAESGSGRGRAAIQLLLEGCPSKYSPLFHDVRVRSDGTLPIEKVLRNLLQRPESEHRQLLNRGLVDLIERGLSMVMDEVMDENAVDSVLEATAGYRQAIGL
jgi:hypothetical protein